MFLHFALELYILDLLGSYGVRKFLIGLLQLLQLLILVPVEGPIPIICLAG